MIADYKFRSTQSGAQFDNTVATLHGVDWLIVSPPTALIGQIAFFNQEEFHIANPHQSINLFSAVDGLKGKDFTQWVISLADPLNFVNFFLQYNKGDEG